MTPKLRLIHGDCREVMAGLEPGSVHAIVTDPPYGLEFMGKEWDRFKPTRSSADARERRAAEMFSSTKRPFIAAGVEAYVAGRPFQDWCTEWATEALRLLPPGGHVLAFGGTRTVHRLAAGLEDAGFEIRDMLAWIYGSGFPKSHNVSKAIDRSLGAVRAVVGTYQGASNIGRTSDGKWGYGHDGSSNAGADRTVTLTAPATEAAREWDGWGTALKPAMEPIVLARKPLDGTVAQNVLRHGTGGINIDGCRVGYQSQDDAAGAAAAAEARGRQTAGRSFEGWGMGAQHLQAEAYLAGPAGRGRWPANVIHDGSEEATRGFQDAAGDAGSAARFFYTAKANAKERRGSSHPTVKPVDLIRYLVRLITPPGGTVLDPFAGTGTTGEAALAEGFSAVLIEQDATYLQDIDRRADGAQLGIAFPAESAES